VNITNGINNNQPSHDSAIRSLNLIRFFSGAFAFIIGIVILAGYIFGNYFLFNLGKDYIPMADESALLFIIIGLVILLIDKSRNNRRLQYLILALSIFVGLIGILASIDFLTNYTYNFSEILGGHHKLIGNMYIGKMSLITALNFIVYSISLILIIYKFEKISAIFSTLILFVGYILITGYWFGVPFLYGGTYVPVALPTAIVMFISSFGMLSAAGYDCPPLKYFFGESTQARLMRSFIPIIFFYNLFQDSILTLGKENINSYFALQNSIVDILSLILTSFIISLVSRSLGKSIDNNIAERTKAEEEMRSSRDSLVKLNMELETSRESVLNNMKETAEARNTLEIKNIELEKEISNRKHAEEALRKSEEKYRNIFENAREGIFQTNINGTYISVNPALAKMLGFDSPEELINTIRDISKDSYYDPIERDKYLKMIEKDGFVEGYEYEVKHKDGTKLWFYEDSRAVKDENGRIQYFEGFVLDITERKKIEEEINSLAKFPSENPGPILRISNVGKLFYINEAGLEKLPKWNLQIGKSAPNMLQSVVNKAIETCEIQIIELIHEDVVYSFYVTPIAEAGYANLYGQDITERKLAENKIAKLGLHYQTLIEKAADGIVLLDSNAQFKYVSPSARKMFGYGLTEEISVNPAELTHPDDLQMVLSHLGKLFEVPDYVPTLDYRFAHKEGHWICVETTFSNHLSDPNVESIILNFRDITERKHAEDKIKDTQILLQACIESPKDMIVLEIDNNFQYLNFNSYHKNVMALAYGVDVEIGMNLLDCITNEDDRKKSKINYDRALDGENHITIEEYGDFERYYYETRYNPIFNDKNEIIGATAFSANITERILIEQELTIAKERAEESDNLKTAFLQNMSHEIRTPLNGIIGFSRMLVSEDLSSEDIQDFTNMISLSSERLIEIVNNVLDMSKIQTGQIETVSEPIVINSLFSDLFDFFSHLAEEKNISLNYHNTDDFGRTIYTDEGKLHQIFTNLINNAIKFTHSGGIDYGYEIIDNTIQFYVKDTGVGITEDLHEKIFERFTQAEQSISRSYEGAGLGLAICKGLVELLGGSIRVESEINNGTAFYFTLPLTVGILQSQEDNEIPENSVLIMKSKILIAEDDWVSAQYLIRFFENSKTVLIHAENGKEAVELVKITPDIDLILMDIKMPVMDGIEAAALIKIIRPDLPIIAQTAYAFYDDKQKILSAGFDDYISKPYDTKILNELIDKYLKCN